MRFDVQMCSCARAVRLRSARRLANVSRKSRISTMLSCTLTSLRSSPSTVRLVQFIDEEYVSSFLVHGFSIRTGLLNVPFLRCSQMLRRTLNLTYYSLSNLPSSTCFVSVICPKYTAIFFLSSRSFVSALTLFEFHRYTLKWSYLQNFF